MYIETTSPHTISAIDWNHLKYRAYSNKCAWNSKWTVINRASSANNWRWRGNCKVHAIIPIQEGKLWCLSIHLSTIWTFFIDTVRECVGLEVDICLQIFADSIGIYDMECSTRFYAVLESINQMQMMSSRTIKFSSASREEIIKFHNPQHDFEVAR